MRVPQNRALVNSNAQTVRCLSLAPSPHGTSFSAFQTAAGGQPNGTASDALATVQDLPLAGRRILITAPRQYAGRLISKLVEAGGQPSWWPTISIQRLQSPAQLAELDHALACLILGTPPRPTHIAFTSVNGITGFMERLAVQLQALHATATSSSQSSSWSSVAALTMDGNPSTANDIVSSTAPPSASAAASSTASSKTKAQPSADDMAAAAAWLIDSGVRFCALGADGAALEALGLPVHVAPTEASTQGLVQELGARGEAAGAVVLCPVPHVAGGLTEPPVVPRFLAALEAAGATAIRVPAYDTCLSTVPAARLDSAEPGGRLEERLLEEGVFDAIAFSSTTEAQALCKLVGLDRLLSFVDRKPTLLAAHGPYTAAGVETCLGRPVQIVSKRFGTFDGVVEALGQASWPSGRE